MKQKGGVIDELASFASISFVPKISYIVSLPILAWGCVDLLCFGCYAYRDHASINFAYSDFAKQIPLGLILFSFLTIGIWGAFGVAVGSGRVKPHLIAFCGAWTAKRLVFWFLVVMIASVLPGFTVVLARQFGPEVSASGQLAYKPFLASLYWLPILLTAFLGIYSYGFSPVLNFFRHDREQTGFRDRVRIARRLRDLFPIYPNEMQYLSTARRSPPLHGLSGRIERRLRKFHSNVPDSDQSLNELSEAIHSIATCLRSLVKDGGDDPRFPDARLFPSGWHALEDYLIQRLAQTKNRVRVIVSEFEHPDVITELKTLQRALGFSLRVIPSEELADTESFSEFADKLVGCIIKYLPQLENQTEPIVLMSCSHYATGDYLYPEMINKEVEKARDRHTWRPDWIYNTTHLHYSDFKNFDFEYCQAILVCFHRFFYCPERGSALLCRRQWNRNRRVPLDGSRPTHADPRQVFSFLETLELMLAEGGSDVTRDIAHANKQQVLELVKKHPLQVAGWNPGVKQSPFFTCLEPEDGVWGFAKGELSIAMRTDGLNVDEIQLSGGQIGIRICLTHFTDSTGIEETLRIISSRVRG